MYVKKVYGIDNVLNTQDVEDEHDALQIDEQPPVPGSKELCPGDKQSQKYVCYEVDLLPITFCLLEDLDLTRPRAAITNRK